MRNVKHNRSKKDKLSIALYWIIGWTGYFPACYWRELREWEAAHSPEEVAASRKAWEDHCYSMAGIL